MLRHKTYAASSRTRFRVGSKRGVIEKRGTVRVCRSPAG